MKKVLVLGTGFLGTILRKKLSHHFQVIAGTQNPKESDVRKIDATNIKDVEMLFLAEKPEYVINTIALSSYFLCELDKEKCDLMNLKTVENIDTVCQKINAKLIHVSSSYVFNGERGYYSEGDKPNAKHNYAHAKIAAESLVLKTKDSIVLRLDSIFGYDENFGKLRFGTNYIDGEIKCGSPDVIRAPLYANDIPPIITNLINNNENGIFHIAGPEKMKLIDIQRALASCVGLEKKVKIIENTGWLLRVPRDTSLNISKIYSLGLSTTPFLKSISEIKKRYDAHV